MMNGTELECESLDLLDIEWRTQFAIRLGLDPKEAFDLACGFAGVGQAVRS